MTNMEIKQERERLEAMGYIDVHDLCRDCLVELKIAYMSELVDEGIFAEIMGVDYDEPSYSDIANADEIIPDGFIFEHYGDVGFSVDDFFSLMETED